MNDGTIKTLLLWLIGIVVAAIGAWISIQVKKYLDKTKERHDNGKKLEEQKKTRDAVEPLFDKTNEKLDRLTTKQDAMNKQLELNTEANHLTLRKDILDICDKCERQGYKTRKDAQSVYDFLKVYESMNLENGVVDDAVRSFKKLPSRLDEKYENVSSLLKDRDDRDILDMMIQRRQ